MCLSERNGILWLYLNGKFSAKIKTFFFFPEANTTCDGDKESDGEDVEADNGNSSEDLRKVIIRY